MDYTAGQANRLGNRANNQDRCLLLDHEGTVLLAVADGMGGHARGELAAQAFIDTLSQAFLGSEGLEDPAVSLRDAFRAAHHAIRCVGAAQQPPIQPLTTGVACLIQGGTALWAHVGDSRAYLIRDGKVALRSRDHTRVADMVEAGLITERQARIHPLRNHVSLCLGGTPQPPPVTLGPLIYLVAGDILLLCSDGLWSAVSESRLINLLEDADTAQAIDRLAAAAEQASYPQSDNVSGVALRWAGGRQSIEADTTASRDDAPSCTQNGLQDSHQDPLERAIAEIEQALSEYGGEMLGK